MPAQQSISHWMDSLGEPAELRPALHESLIADVVIVGAGYTGLWTAYYLKRQAPNLNIVILEAQTAGFGASGRNGGWLMGNLLGENRLLSTLPAAHRRESFDLLHGIPDEVAAVLQREGIDCDYRKGGIVNCAARYPEQEASLRAELEALHQLGLSDKDYCWLSPSELAEQLRIAKPYGAIYTPHCATINPAKLVRGLAQTVERMGVRLFEQSAVSNWQKGAVTTAHGRVQASWVVPAIEGYAASLAPLGDYQLPVQSLLVATAPLADSMWAEIGLEHGQAFCEHSRQVTYGQRTLDNRLVFGARGGYQYGGKLRQDFTLTAAEINLRRYLFTELFPQLRDVEISHSWGGNLGMARAFQPHMLCDASSGIALSGGYGGEGVGASNLGGRTLADLILGKPSILTEQPWVIRGGFNQLRRWEPEPCRWLGYNAIIRSFAHEDQILADPLSAPWRRALASRVAQFMQGLMR